MIKDHKINFVNFLIYVVATFAPAVFFVAYDWVSRENIPLVEYMIVSQVILFIAIQFSVGYWPKKYVHTRDDEKIRLNISYIILPIAAHLIQAGIILWGYTEW